MTATRATKFYCYCPSCPALYGPMHGLQVHRFRCACEGGNPQPSKGFTFNDAPPIIVGDARFDESLTLAQLAVSKRLQGLNQTRWDSAEWNVKHPPKLATLRRVRG
jgi:hypothetical protein